MASKRIFYCPTHGRIVAETYYGARTITVVDPPFHPGCHCERWFKGMAKFKAKRSGES